MNPTVLKGYIRMKGDTQKELGKALGLATSTINAKINGVTQFTVDESLAIKKRYSLTDKEYKDIFFDKKRS